MTDLGVFWQVPEGVRIFSALPSIQQTVRKNMKPTSLHTHDHVLEREWSCFN